MLLRWVLLLSTALLCCGPVSVLSATSYTMYVNGQQIQSPNGYYMYTTGGSSSVLVSCQITNSVSNAIVEKIVNGQATDLKDDVVHIVSGQNTFLNYTRDASIPLQSPETYRCKEVTSSPCPAYVQVTLLFSSTSAHNAPTIRNCPPGGPPVTTPSTRPPSSGGTSSPKFAGLNPLIYTISAVILLGTLAIVAIITCWIRARRSYNRRMFQANTDPQDYLDYISDNEFTPLTTSEFVASLQERPPTYHESEEIQGQMAEGANEGEESREGGGATEGTGTTPAGATANAGQSTGTRTGGSSRTPPARPPPPTTSVTAARPRPQATPTNGAGSTGSRPPNRESSPSSGDGVETAVLVGTSSSPAIDTAQSLQGSNASTTQNSGTRDDVTGGTEDQVVVGVSMDEPLVVGGVDALLALDMGNGNGTQSWTVEPLPPLTASNEPPTSVATLIDLDFGLDSDSGSQAVSDSQSTFQPLSQPTPEQISEIEAAVGAINKRMTEIRERTE